MHPQTVNSVTPSKHSHLGKFGGSSTSNLGNSELGQFHLQIIQLFQQLLLFLPAKVPGLDLCLQQQYLLVLFQTNILHVKPGVSNPAPGGSASVQLSLASSLQPE